MQAALRRLCSGLRYGGAVLRKVLYQLLSLMDLWSDSLFRNHSPQPVALVVVPAAVKKLAVYHRASGVICVRRRFAPQSLVERNGIFRSNFRRSDEFAITNPSQPNQLKPMLRTALP